MIGKYLVFMHIMCVEEHLDEDGDLGSDVLKSVPPTVVKDKAPMWCGLALLSTSSTFAVPGSLAGLCEVKRLMEDQA